MSLAALSETLEALLTILRKLSTELACTKIHGCPVMTAGILCLLYNYCLCVVCHISI
jgi:hypothetical protein